MKVSESFLFFWEGFSTEDDSHKTIKTVKNSFLVKTNSVLNALGEKIKDR